MVAFTYNIKAPKITVCRILTARCFLSTLIMPIQPIFTYLVRQRIGDYMDSPNVYKKQRGCEPNEQRK